MSIFSYELASAIQAQGQMTGSGADGLYGLPWYLVIGEPGSGRSSTIVAMNQSCKGADSPVPTNAPNAQCSYWLSEQGLFIEPGSNVLGATRDASMLQLLCYELAAKRVREPVDGIVVNINARFVADANEDDLQRYSSTLRRYLIEIAQALDNDIPTYIVVTHFDAIWGFGDVFKWSADRKDEQGWGFCLPLSLEPEAVETQIPEYMAGLRGRIELMCFDKMSGELPTDVRIRCLQHLADCNDLMDALDQLVKALALGNAFERAPWVRALALGSAAPGTGQKLRHRAEEFQTMGLVLPTSSGTPQPGGLPLHNFASHVLLPERDIVPTKVRWRDDRAVVVLFVLAILAWMGTIATVLLM
jgi:type VI protein secretion system component VasK